MRSPRIDRATSGIQRAPVRAWPTRRVVVGRGPAHGVPWIRKPPGQERSRAARDPAHAEARTPCAVDCSTAPRRDTERGAFVAPRYLRPEPAALADPRSPKGRPSAALCAA